MIKIHKSKTADTRSCDFTKVDRAILLESTIQHIADVKHGLEFFEEMLYMASKRHDIDKITDLDTFHKEFITGFKTTIWYDNHRKINRHHLLAEDGIPEDVNLIDVLEMVVDCVMAGMGRSGTVYPIELKPEVLEKALANTVNLLKENVEVVD